MELSLIIPIKNEDERVVNEIIKNSIKILKKYGEFEILIVAKYDENHIPNFLSDPRVRIIKQGNNGKGNGMKLGVKKAKGEIIVFMDGDGSHIISDIPKLVDPIRGNKADIVLASRMIGGSEELHGDFSQFFRLTATSLISLVIFYRFGVRISDTQNGLRAIRKKIFKKLDLKAGWFDIETEMVMKCIKRGYRIKEIPSRELSRKVGKSRISLFKQWHRYVWRILVNLF